MSLQELPYRIEMWDDHDTRIEELIALVADHLVARAAFAEAPEIAARMAAEGQASVVRELDRPARPGDRGHR